MKLCIAQPTFLPWLGYFNLISQADVFIVLDDVQFEKQSWQCRNRIKGRDGREIMLTVPVKKHRFGEHIKDVWLAKNVEASVERHLKTMQQAYSKAPHYDQIYSFVSAFSSANENKKLRWYCMDFILNSLTLLHIDAPVLIQSKETKSRGAKADLVLDLCEEVGATTYLAQAGAKGYLEPRRALFDHAGIEIVYQDYEHPEYQQIGKGDFMSHLSIIDALFNCGWGETEKMVKEGWTCPSKS